MAGGCHRFVGLTSVQAGSLPVLSAMAPLRTELNVDVR